MTPVLGGRHATAAVALVLAWSVRSAAAQQPFVVDDAGVAGRGVWHVEVSSQIDTLRSTARPARWQHVLEWEVDVGLGRRLEAAAILPVVSVVSNGVSGRVAATGVGDATVGVKWRLTDDPAAAHSTAFSGAIEFPSGSQRRGLGSGLVDYGLNVVSEHVLHPRATVRVNAGAILAGNTQTGALGIRERGAVVTSGVSLVGAVNRMLQAGAELTLAWSQKTSLAGSAAGWQVGAKVAVRDGATIDGSVLGGWFDASPRWGVQLGMSVDLH